ncbi:MAG: transposase, partial [Candidatus Thermoplasmatota archaeon]|nr:transposase [Candidatus Thermoplasmatota archaeon]
MDIVNYGLREKYEQLKKFGDRLSEMKDIIDWDRIKPLLSDLYKNDTEKGGRPNFDPVFMVKIMFLQSLYGIVDEAMEIELYSNIRFMNFLDYPESVPDARTIWLFRERIANYHKDKEIWKSIWKQFQEKGITVKKGTIQDATFIESDPGHGKRKKGDGTMPVHPRFPEKPAGQEKPETGMSRKEMKAAKRMEKEQKKKEREEERRNARTRRSKDGTWAVKNKKDHFGHKLHTSQTVDHDIIANYAVTTASVHDSQIDLSIPGIVNYKDKGYFGVEGRGIDATMDKSLRGYKLPVESIRRNMRI